ncbi:hypothetical protein Pla163_10700 [Planctomycetes bacterium Pla163]|uniref:Sulfatase n=1 Tax=Rohdeia mirabilis TaxID=2528008 RepID=A0A518CXL7_9BACT|nr:hypothetical protein Pla163_10700 [Planctomycetes bacterium Pla163]
MDPLHERQRLLTRRGLLSGGAGGLGALALGSLLGPNALAGAPHTAAATDLPHFAPKAKRVIYLFMSGGPSHIDLFDFKPKMRELHGIELPESIRQGQRLTTMTSGQTSFPCVAPMFEFARHGQHRTWVSELLPHTAGIVDDITLVKSMHTEAINHDPAITFINTGNQQPGKPSMGSWLSYGLGSMNRNLPDYVVMISRGRGNLQALYSRLWGSGFLPSQHQGVKFRSGADPVLYLSNPDGIDAITRRRMLDGIAEINAAKRAETGDPEVEARIAQYEMAYRMQTSVPELMDLSDEPERTFEEYGEDARRPGTFAANCVLARRLAERDVRFVQLFHRGWDGHNNLPGEIRGQAMDTDRASAALVRDLKRRGLLDDTLVVWGGEFGRTIYSQGQLTETNHGRDHHGRAFTIWLAGGGIKRGHEHGATDDFAYNITADPVHIRDLNATILHQLGIDHERFTYPYQGLDQRLTGVEEARVVREILG